MQKTTLFGIIAQCYPFWLKKLVCSNNTPNESYSTRNEEVKKASSIVVGEGTPDERFCFRSIRKGKPKGAPNAPGIGNANIQECYVQDYSFKYFLQQVIDGVEMLHEYRPCLEFFPEEK